MSPFQLAKQIRHIIRTATWADSPAGLIIGTSCYITSGVREDDDLPARLPYVLLNLGDQKPDDDEPALLRQEVIVVLAAAVEGDPLGEHALVGGPSGQGATNRFGKSQGRGLLELETALLTSIGSLTGANGTSIIVSHGSAPSPERHANNQHLVFRQYILSAVCTRADEYPAPQNLTVDVSVAGQATLAWTLPPSMYGTRQIVCRRASGGTAPTSATAGTPVTLATDLATSVTVSGLSAGVHSFALFMGYTESGAASNEKYSSQVTGSYRSGTVT